MENPWQFCTQFSLQVGKTWVQTNKLNHHQCMSLSPLGRQSHLDISFLFGRRARELLARLRDLCFKLDLGCRFVNVAGCFSGDTRSALAHPPAPSACVVTPAVCPSCRGLCPPSRAPGFGFALTVADSLSSCFSQSLLHWGKRLEKGSMCH